MKRFDVDEMDRSLRATAALAMADMPNPPPELQIVFRAIDVDVAWMRWE